MKPKFKAIDQFSDQFIFGQAFFIDSDNNQGYISNGIDRHHCVKKETDCQFTGITDKNGEELYNKDAILCTVISGDSGEEEVKCIIDYDETLAMYTISFKYNENEITPHLSKCGINGWWLPLSDCSNITKLGSIITNPELIK